jgi:hypothetical protein
MTSLLCVYVCVTVRLCTILLKLCMTINSQIYACFVNYVVSHQLPLNALSAACTCIYILMHIALSSPPSCLSHSLCMVHIFSKIFLGYQLLQVVEW